MKKSWHIQYHLKDAIEMLGDLPGKSVDLISIDPPYGTDPGEFIKKFATKNVRDPTKRRGRTNLILKKAETANVSPNMLLSGKTYEHYLKDFFDEAHRVLKSSGNLCIFQGLNYLGPTYELIPPKFYFRNIIIYGFWSRRSVAKTNLGTAYIPILWVSKSTGYYRNAKHIRKYFPNLDHGLTIEKPVGNIWLTKRTSEVKYYSAKPLAIMMCLIEFLCPPGGLVVDNFAGSGVTGEAAILTGRRCIMSDLYEDALLTAKCRLIKYMPDIGKFYKRKD